ncbi:preprotein translocase subunit YajC [Ignavigranum ruoffiae]|uniref:preprotein translocase subunit YajC n=1 Tax=Ignavigranum ruoffiae TaxID=89093 RepID=UPI0024ACC23E|nr:preprotein translocase subunit YajC [Ignavigranum ruoffiae]
MNMLVNLVPLLLMFAVMYFLMIRPQKKQMEEKKNMLSSLRPGQEVVTIGGLHGLVEEVQHDTNKIVIDCEGVYLTFELSAIAKVVDTPAATNATVSVKDLSPEEHSEEIEVVEGDIEEDLQENK